MLSGDRETQISEENHAWVISLTFWACLFCATALYAAVALAPKLLTNLNLKNAYHTHQAHLVNLERQNDHLQKVVDALEHEPGFQAELARFDFDAFPPNEERIAVGEGLTLTNRLAPPSFETPVYTLPWYGPLVETLTYKEQLRALALILSAVLTVVAFSCLHDSWANHLRACAVALRAGLRAILRRYYKPSAAEISDQVSQ